MNVSRLWISGAVLAVVVAAAPAKATEHGHAQPQFMLQSGDEAWVNTSGDLDQAALRARYGDHFAAFVRDGRTFVITNKAVIGQLERLYAPVVDLGHQQAALGSKQAALGSQQARLGGQQAELGAEQATLATNRAARVAGTGETLSDLETRQRALGDKQRSLGDEQRALGDQQRALGQQQRVLGDHQRALIRETAPKLERIFGDAVTTGTAIEVR